MLSSSLNIEELLDDSLYVLDDIVEKPAVEKAPSNIGAIGRYVFTPEIFDCIKKTSSGVGNEIQLTDGIRNLNRSQKVYGYKFNGTRYDTGDKAEYVKAIINFALNNEGMKNNILEYLQKVISDKDT